MRQHLQRLYAGRLDAGLSPASVVQLHTVLRRALGQAARWGLVVRNVVSLVTPPRLERREMTTLSPEQVRNLLDAATGGRLEALYVLAVTTGMRQGEILALRWRDVNLDVGTLQVRATLQRNHEGFVFAEPKTAHSRRKVALGRATVEALRSHRSRQLGERLKFGAAWEDNDLVFANEVGRPMEATNLRNRFFGHSWGGLASLASAFMTFGTLRLRCCWAKEFTPRSSPRCSGTLRSPSPWTSTAT